jgi:endogenous inhibitor of DNA gyrase (YacG/DUF329 family)
MAMGTYHCQHCGKAFRRDNAHPPKFCSLTCSSASRKRVLTATCRQCGTEFSRRSKDCHGPPKFCSQKCNLAFRRESNPEAMERFRAASLEHAAKKKGTGKHGIYRYNKHGCRCDVCKAAAKHYNDRNRKPLPPKHGVRRYRKFGCRCQVCCAAERRSYEKMRAKWARNSERLRTVTPAEQAPRWGYIWTGPELEIASRSDLTATEVAKMIGRTAQAVKTMRRKLEIDPRKINLAGVVKRTDLVDA